MKRSLGIVGVVLALTIASAGYHSQRPVGHGEASGECGNCHADTPPADHTAKFITAEHGKRAWDERRRCLGCHRDQMQDCQACHQRDNPSWHTKSVREPGAGIPQRNEHRKAAAEHRSACAGCHTPLFQLQCANCHRADERWLLDPTGAAR